MAVAFDVYSESAANTDPADVSHAGAASGVSGIVVGMIQTNTADELGGITYDGNALAEVSGSPQTEATEGIQTRAYFDGVGVSQGTKTVAYNVTATTGTKLFYNITLTGAADLEIVDVKTLSSASQADPTVTLALGGRSCFCVVFGMSGHGAVGSVAPLTGDWTVRDETTTGTELGLCYTYNTIGTTDVSAGWLQTAEDAVLIALAIGEVVGGAGAVPLKRRLLLGVGR